MLILQYNLIITEVIDDFSSFIESFQELAKIMLHQIISLPQIRQFLSRDTQTFIISKNVLGFNTSKIPKRVSNLG